jgi:hypothetical protein
MVDNSSLMPFQKPIEIKIADAFFVRINMREKHLQFTDLSEKHAHYSFWSYGSTIDFHKTLEPHNNLPKKQIPLFKKELDLQLLTERIAQEIAASQSSLFRITKINNPEWQDLEIDFIPLQMLMELLQPIVKRNRWNIDADFLEKLEQSSRYAKIGELAEYGSIMGTASEGHFVLSSGTHCMLSDQTKLSKIMEKHLELSIRNLKA